MQNMNAEEIDFVSGGHFSFGGFIKSIGEGAAAGIGGGAASAGVKDRNFSKGGYSVAAGIIGGGIAGGITYIIHNH